MLFEFAYQQLNFRISLSSSGRTHRRSHANAQLAFIPKTLCLSCFHREGRLGHGWGVWADPLKLVRLAHLSSPYVPLGAPTSAGTNERPMLRVRRSHLSWQVRPRLLRRAAGTLLNLSPDLGFLHGGLGSGLCLYFFAWPELGRKRTVWIWWHRNNSCLRDQLVSACPKTKRTSFGWRPQ